MENKKQILILSGIAIFIGIVKFVAYLVFTPPYSYDEVIIRSIAKLNINEMLEVIKAEPHPPGMYFFLHFLPLGNEILTKFIIMVISLSLYSTVIFVLQKSNHINKYFYWSGIFLFISTYFFSQNIDTLKHVSITLPLTLLSLSLLTLDRKEKNGIRFIDIANNIILIILLFFGYIPFAFTLLVYGAYLLVNKLYKPLFLALIINIIGIVLSLYFYLFEQIQINATRFTWVKEQTNSIYNFLLLTVQEFSQLNFLTDIVFTLLLVGLVCFMFKIFKDRNSNKFEYITFILFIGSLLLGYALSTHTRTRYNPLFIVSICFCVAWGLAYLKIKYLSFVAIITLILLTAYSNIFYPMYRERFMGQINADLNTLLQENQKYALLSHPELKSYVFLESYLNLKYEVEPTNIIPTSTNKLATQEVIASTGKLDFFLIQSESKQDDLFKKYLKQYEGYNFIVLRSSAEYNFRSYKLLNLFNKYCSLSENKSVSFDTQIFIYENCEN